MTVIITRSLFTLALVVSLVPATAAEKRADDVLRECTDSDSAMRLSCLAYMSGFMDGIELGQAGSSSEMQRICLPDEGVSAEQARRVVVKWLQDHPKNLHESGRIQVFLAMADAFPCRK